jgi:putative multiple sugar transport system ATP-binding protein
MTNTILEMRAIRKTFPGVVALDNEPAGAQRRDPRHRGENGAGKSTLMKVLSGVYGHGSYTGDIDYQGQTRHFRGIKDSEEIGIIIIHQELALVPLLSIAENIFLGNEPAKWGHRLGIRASEDARAAAKVGLKESPDTLVTNLGVGKQQLIEIAKALCKDVKLLILDEPPPA